VVLNVLSPPHHTTLSRHPRWRVPQPWGLCVERERNSMHVVNGISKVSCWFFEALFTLTLMAVLTCVVGRLRTHMTFWPPVGLRKAPHHKPPVAKTLHKKTVHKHELRGCGDLFIWFGGPLEKSFQGPVVCWSLESPIAGCYWLLKQSNQFLILFSLLCGPWANAVLLKCHNPHSLAKSSSIMSLRLLSGTPTFHLERAREP
jgi:hypothetical protein